MLYWDNKVINYYNLFSVGFQILIWDFLVLEIVMSGLSKIYTFDLDGNLLNTPTTILFEEQQADWTWKEIEVEATQVDANPEKYYHNDRIRFLHWDKELSFQNFRDSSPDPRHNGDQQFLKDIHYALDTHRFAPSIYKLKESLVTWQLVAILTARWHAPSNLKGMLQLINQRLLDTDQKAQQLMAIKNNFDLSWLSDEEVLETYFSYNWYFPVSNIQRCQENTIERSITPSIKKTLAMDIYLKQTKDLFIKLQQEHLFETLSCGFSDDSVANIKSMISYFLQISSEKKYLKDYHLYYTRFPTNYERITEHLWEEREKYVFLNLPEIKKDPEHGILKISLKN